MRNCETYEEQLSALIDQQLESVEILPVTDHLADCAACRSFYVQARALDDMVTETALTQLEGPAPDDVWRKIQADRAESHAAPAAVAARAGWPSWAHAAAAMLVLGAVWLAAAAWRDGGGPQIEGLAQPVAQHGMSDARFIELTRELLEADPRYHSEMLSVMRAVSSMNHREGAVDSRPRAAETREESDELLEASEVHDPQDDGLSRL